MLHDIASDFLKSIFRESRNGVGSGGRKWTYSRKLVGRKKDSGRARLKHSKLQKMASLFRFKAHGISRDY